MQAATKLARQAEPPWLAPKTSNNDPRAEAVTAFREFADCLEARVIDYGNVQWNELPTMPFLVRMFARAPRDGMDGIKGFSRTEMLRQRGPTLMRSGPELPAPIGRVLDEYTVHCAEQHVPTVDTELETVDPLKDAIGISRDVARRLESRELQGARVSYFADESGVQMSICEVAWGQIGRVTNLRFVEVRHGE